MATQRARKKKARRQELQLAAHVGQSAPIRAVRIREVCVPCPACAHPSMERRYLPMLGGASGSARCSSCNFELPYEQLLAAAMGERASSEPVALPRSSALVVAEDAQAPAVLVRELMIVALTVLRQLFGLRRRWSFA